MNKSFQPTKVRFVFSDGSEAEHPLEGDHLTVMGWWKHTTRYVRMTKLIAPLDDTESSRDEATERDQ